MVMHGNFDDQLSTNRIDPDLFTMTINLARAFDLAVNQIVGIGELDSGAWPRIAPRCFGAGARQIPDGNGSAGTQ